MNALSKIVVLAASLVAAGANAAVVTVDPGASWQGFMNVFEIPQHGGAFVFNSAWGTADLTATFAGPVLTLGPNTIGDPNSFWYSPSGGPGAIGNKTMDASMFVETTGVCTGQTLTFSGDVLANTLAGHVDPNGNGWTSVAFVADFAPDYSSFSEATAPLNNGVFSVSLPTLNDPNRHIRFGFETIGPDVWATDVAQYGSVQITAATAAVPEPSALALLAFGLVGVASRRKPVK